MAGVVPFSSCSTGRKQWNLRDKRSVRRLRSQLAEDGCPESQVVLAKQLLQEKSMISSDDNEENARLGVFWLMKASEQGNMEATNILKKCLDTGEGITEHNYLDVKTCLSTSQNEKLARRAAREMFLSLSAGQDFITSEQLWRRMTKIDSLPAPLIRKNVRASAGELSNGEAKHSHLSAEEEEPDNGGDSTDEDNPGSSRGWAGREGAFGEKLTEDHLESAASTYSRGELPLVQRVLTLTDPRQRDLEHLNYLQRTLLHPLLTIQNAYVKLLDTLGSRYRNPMWRVLPSFHQVQLALLLLLLPLLSLQDVIMFLPMCVYYASYLAMVVSTLQTLQSKREYSTFRVWSRLFLSYDRGGNLNTEDAEFEYCKNNLRPFAWFFLSLLVNLMVYPLISEQWIPESELAVVALTLTFVTLASFQGGSRRIDLLMLFSFGINVLAKYPYESDGVVRQTWRFLDLELPTVLSYGLPCFASQVVGNGVEFCLNFRGFFYLLIPGIFMKMAHREGWKGTYKVLIPHCVTLAWWQVAVLCSQGATLYGLIRSTLAMVGFVLFLPLVGLATLILPLVAVLRHLSDAALTPKTGITTFLAFLPLMLGYVLDKRRGVQMGTYLSKVQIFLAVVAGLFLVCPSMNDLMATSPQEADMPVPATLTWEQYSSLCHRNAWDKRVTADNQLDCMHFSHLAVNWEGILQDVEIMRIHNPFSKMLELVPETLKDKVSCWYGQHYPEDCSEFSTDEVKQQLCTTLKQVGYRNRCHLTAWDRYELQLTVKLKSSGAWSTAESPITVVVEDSMKNFSLALRSGDHVWFAARLTYPETIGTGKLRVLADELGCINCANKELTSMKRATEKLSWQAVLRETSNGVKRVLNFLFSPVLVFR